MDGSKYPTSSLDFYRNTLKEPVCKVTARWKIAGAIEIETKGISRLVSAYVSPGRYDPKTQSVFFENGPNLLFTGTFLHAKDAFDGRDSWEAALDTLRIRSFMPVDSFAKLKSEWRRLHLVGGFRMSFAKEVWMGLNVHLDIGNLFDGAMKKIFNETITETQLLALPSGVSGLCKVLAGCYEAVAAGIKVSTYPMTTPSHLSHCDTHCKAPRSHFVTEVDLVSSERGTGQLVLMELKTFKNAVMDPRTLKRYNLQAWLTWLLFGLTYPKLAPRTHAEIVVIMPCIYQVHFFKVTPPPITKKLINFFPFLEYVCRDRLFWLTPKPCKPRTVGSFRVASFDGACLVVDNRAQPQPKYLKRGLDRLVRPPPPPLSPPPLEREDVTVAWPAEGPSATKIPRLS